MTTAIKTATAPIAAEPKISPVVQALSNVFYTSMTANKDGTVGVPDDIIEANLPEDVTMAMIKRVQKHRGEVVAATALALSKAALPIMHKNKDVARVGVEFKIGSDKLDMAIEREREFNDGKGGKVIKHGYVNLSYTASGATNAGEFKKARQQISSEYLATFSPQ